MVSTVAGRTSSLRQRLINLLGLFLNTDAHSREEEAVFLSVSSIARVRSFTVKGEDSLAG